MEYPQRHPNHSLEERSVNFLRRYLPCDWNVNSVDRDYGKDMEIEICQNGRFKGLEFIVQLKSSREPNNLNGYELQRLRVSTYNYLWDNLRVVLIVKYVESEDEAYWILLKDVAKPSQEDDTFTIRIPRHNPLSQIDWNDIVDHVTDVTSKKLDVLRND